MGEGGGREAGGEERRSLPSLLSNPFLLFLLHRQLRKTWEKEATAIIGLLLSNHLRFMIRLHLESAVIRPQINAIWNTSDTTFIYLKVSQQSVR